MIIELLAPDTIQQKLEERLQLLKQTQKEVEKETRRLPEGSLRISQKAKHIEYYATSKADNPGTYIPKGKMKLAAQLAQRTYNLRIIKLLAKEIRTLEAYFEETENGKAISNFYNNLCLPRRKLITPITLPDEQFIEEWQKVEWTGHPFAEDAPQLFTTKGERVRSKSEVQIADSLNRFGIPYRYEYPLRLKTGMNIYPDFYCLNVRTRQELYWEHFGMMDNPEYAKNAVQKLQQYNSIQIIPGKNLIITMETSTSPLNVKYIEQQIKSYLT